MKLSKAQKIILLELGEGTWCHYADSYKPIAKLLEMEMVTVKPAKFGGKLFRITPAGRLALEAQNGK